MSAVSNRTFPFSITWVAGLEVSNAPSSATTITRISTYALVAKISSRTDAYVTSRRERKKVEMLFAHLKRILKLDRLRLRGPNGARDEFLLAATAQNLRKMAKLIPMPATAAPA
jgi:Transposase DDE domain